MPLTYRQVVEVADALRAMPRAAGRVDWSAVAAAVSRAVGYRVSPATVRNVANQTRALDAPREDSLAARVKRLEEALEASRLIDRRLELAARVAALEESNKPAEAPKPAPVLPASRRYGSCRGY